MRSIFLVLLISNIAFFAHEKFFGADRIVEGTGVQGVAVVDAVNNLVLLSERERGAAKPASALKRVVAERQLVEEPRGELCTMIGPFEQLLYAENLVEQLSALGVGAQVMDVEVKTGEVYWVYLSPEMSEKEAWRRLYELQKKNIESYIITKGELANGVSFGRFADALAAENKKNEIERLGYEVKIKNVTQTIKETWVMLDAQSDVKIRDSAWLELLGRKESLEKRQNYCLGVAS
jgi:hypothetical protein